MPVIQIQKPTLQPWNAQSGVEVGGWRLGGDHARVEVGVALRGFDRLHEALHLVRRMAGFASKVCFQLSQTPFQETAFHFLQQDMWPV